jgi:hypothetical protein
MAPSDLALVSVLVGDRTRVVGNSRSLGIELLQRATRDDYDRWLDTALAAGGCVRPVRLRGTIRDIDTMTGEILHGLDTEDLPDKAIYVPCGDRRASVCPPCGETYQADTYQLIRAGLVGGKGMPESLAAHPSVFATFTAPSFGPVHTRVITSNGTVARCRPRRKATFCRTGAASPAGSGTRKPMPAWVGPRARTVTTTPRLLCGTLMRLSCGVARPSLSAAAWTSSQRFTAGG